MRKVAFAVSVTVCFFSMVIILFSMYNLSAVLYGRGFQEWPWWALFPALLFAVLSALCVNANFDESESLNNKLRNHQGG